MKNTSKRGSVVILLATLVTVAFIFGAVLFEINNGPKSQSNQNSPETQKEPEPAPEPTDAPGIEVPYAPRPTYKKTFYSKLGYKFQYPDRWSVSSYTVPKGEQKNRPGQYSVFAVDHAVEVVDITYENWMVEIQAYTTPTAEPCGGQGSVSGYELLTYKYLKVLNQDAARKNIENGNYWHGSDEPEPHPQPIMFPVNVDDLPAEERRGVSNPIDVASYWFKWCPKSIEGKPQISITYYSDQFMEKPIENKSVDIEILAEMDNIIRTISYTPKDTSAEVGNWKIFTSKFGFSFKHPNKVVLKEQTLYGEKGFAYCINFERNSLLGFLDRKAFAGAAGCYSPDTGMGGLSPDFEAGRSGGFHDTNGYYIKEGSVIYKFAGDKDFEVPKELVITITTNQNGVEYVVVRGKNEEGGSPFPVMGTPGDGYFGALINTGNDKIPGIAFSYSNVSELLTDKEFYAILESFKTNL